MNEGQAEISGPDEAVFQRPLPFTPTAKRTRWEKTLQSLHRRHQSEESRSGKTKVRDKLRDRALQFNSLVSPADTPRPSGQCR